MVYSIGPSKESQIGAQSICVGAIYRALDVVEGNLIKPSAIMENATVEENAAYKIALDEFIKADSNALELS